MRKLLSISVLSLLIFPTLKAAIIDWGSVAVSGSYPNFEFTDSVMGEVDIDYTSPNHAFASGATPINYQWGSVPTMSLGGRVDLSWENALTRLVVRIYDLDLSEYADLILEGDASVSVVESKNGSSLTGTRVDGVASDLYNSSPNNYIELLISGSGFSSLGISQWRGSLPIASGLGYGDPVAVQSSTSNVPDSVAGMGLVSLLALLGAGRFLRGRP